MIVQDGIREREPGYLYARCPPKRLGCCLLLNAWASFEKDFTSSKQIFRYCRTISLLAHTGSQSKTTKEGNNRRVHYP